MAQGTVIDQFISHLREAEITKDVRALADLFAPGARLENLTRPIPSRGAGPRADDHLATTDCPTAFWRQYLKAFDRVETTFQRVTDDGKCAVLEWRSEGLLPMGLPIHYAGVSLLEYENGKIKKFRTYYDSAAFLAHMIHHPDSYPKTVGAPEMTIEVSS